ncbi:MAG: cysteine desulfurase NifS [Coriobacteriaceae bacterium]|nr:cysteine desulfurase NifS [Coriobacteriaceae bacterium]
MKTIYLDNAATTAVLGEVLEVMLPYFTEQFGNPSSIYPLGQAASDTIARARCTIATELKAIEAEVYFTSGGSEANNWAIKGVAQANAKKGRHIITSAIEHHSILHTCQALEKIGFEITYLPVDRNGMVDSANLKAALRSDTILVSIMFANNEIGTIQPIAELARITHDHGALFHTDAVQAFCHEAIDVQTLGIDLLSASAHKINGPKGVGLLYARKGIAMTNLIEGGWQERGRRGGTENVSGIVGFAKAVELTSAERQQEHDRQTQLRNHAIARILAEIPYSRLNGHATHRLANNINISFEFIEGEGMLLQMASRGICVSSGSACTSGSLDPSHVLLAIGLPQEIAHGSLRMTLGRTTSYEDIDYAVDSLVQVIGNLRMMSPLWEDFKAYDSVSLIEALAGVQNS